MKQGLDFYEKFAGQNEEAVRARSQTALAYHRVGLLQYALGEWEPAEESFRRSIEYFETLTREEPENAEYLCGLGDSKRDLASVVSEGNRRELREDALIAYSKVIEIQPNDQRTRLSRADILLSLGAYEKAIEDCSHILREKPKNRIALFIRANSSKSLGEFEKAIADLDKACRLYPRDCFAFLYRGLLHGNMQNYDQALADLNEAVRLSPRIGSPYAARAELHYSLQDYERAIADANEAIRFNSREV